MGENEYPTLKQNVTQINFRQGSDSDPTLALSGSLFLATSGALCFKGSTGLITQLGAA